METNTQRLRSGYRIYKNEKYIVAEELLIFPLNGNQETTQEPTHKK